MDVYRSVAAALALATLTIAGPAVVAADAGPGALRLAGGGATVRWGAHHIPLIKARSWYGIGYGQAYTQATDNLCTLADRFAR